MTDTLTLYADHLNASSEVRAWLSTTGKKALAEGAVSESALEHVLDYLTSDAAPKRLRKMSIKQALASTEKWTKANQKKGRDLVEDDSDIEHVLTFEDGSKIVRLLTERAFKREGFLMSHCLGSYDPNNGADIYSYRDSDNKPHATFEVKRGSGSSEILQIKGKGNGAIHPRYIEPVLAFLKHLGLNIRPTEMRNLGYYHIAPEFVSVLQNEYKVSTKLVTVAGEFYAV